MKVLATTALAFAAIVNVNALTCNYAGEYFPVCTKVDSWDFENGTVCVGISICWKQSSPYGVVKKNATTPPPPPSTPGPTTRPVTTPPPTTTTTRPPTTPPPTTPSPTTARYFGTATDNPGNFGTIVPNTFGMLVCENAMKWGPMQSGQSSYNYNTAKNIQSYAQQNGMKMRGHVLVYHNQLPSFMCQATGGQDGAMCTQTSLSGTQLEQQIDARIKGIFENLDSNTIIAWDVVNEAIMDSGSSPLKNSIFVQKMGTNYVETVFKIARKYAPANVKLFYNDYNCEVYNNQKTNWCYDLVKNLASKGLVDGMGFQMHLSLQYGENSQMGGFDKTVKMYTDLGLEIHITEMDVTIQNTQGSESQLFQTQANWYANIAKICAATPKCNTFIVWGVTDNTSWRSAGKPLLFDSNSQKKSAFSAVVNNLGTLTKVPK